MGSLASDLRLALRRLGRFPASTAAVVLTLSLGIGVNVAVFCLVNAALLRPLPYPEPEAVVIASESNLERGWRRFGVSTPDYRDWAEQVGAFAHVAAFYSSAANLSGGGGAQRVEVASVTSDMLPVLGLAPHLGRGFGSEDERQGADVVLLSFGFWQAHFGGDPEVIGDTLRLGEGRHTIVGVLPPEISDPFDGVEVFRPLTLEGDERRGARWLRVMGRLGEGVSIDQARTELATVARRQERDFPETNAGWSSELLPLRELSAEGSRHTLLLLASAAGLVLLLACANVAHLLLVRALGQRKDLAIRAALGADGVRLGRQVLTESLLLASLGGLGGVALAAVGQRGLLGLVSDRLPGVDTAPLDLRVLAFAVAASLLSGALFGLAPTSHVLRRGLFDSLRAGAGGTATPARRRIRRGLVVAELAVAFALLSAVGVLGRTLIRLLDVDPGFDPQGALTLRVAPPQVRAQPGQSEEAFINAFLEDRDRAARFYDDLVTRLEALPGVEAAGAVNRLPLTGRWWILDYDIPGQAPTGPGEGRSAYGRAVTTDYFRTMGIPTRKGRGFEGRDGPDGPRVVVVNEALARRDWGSSSPVGERIELDGPGPAATIVGVVGSIRTEGLDQEESATFYVPVAQAMFGFYPDWGMDLVVRAHRDPLGLVPAVREQVRALNPDLPVFAVRTLEDVLGRSIERRRLAASLLGLFSLLALGLAAVGLYGVLAHATRERTREFGVRLALGAGNGTVLRQVLWEGLSLAGMGIALGVLGALGAGSVLGSLLFGVSSADPMTLSGVAALLSVVAALAAALPALRASRVDPAWALRTE